MFVDEQGDEQIMAIAPALLPELLGIVARGEEYGAPLQRKALSILHTILEVLQVGVGGWAGGGRAHSVVQCSGGSGSGWCLTLALTRACTAPALCLLTTRRSWPAAARWRR